MARVAGRVNGAERSQSATPILVVDGIELRFGGIRALDGVNLEVGRGSITALIGPNGAGKTTLFGVIAGFLRPSRGRVVLGGEDVTGLAPPRLFARGLMRTFQIPAVYERMTVLDNLLMVPGPQAGENLLTAVFASRAVNREEKAFRERAERVIAFLDLAPVRDNYAGQLSGGQKKLLELGRVMMTDSKVVLLDEPGAGVNPTLMKKLTDSIRRLNAEWGYTFLIIEHDMDLVAALCDPVIVMAEGKVLAQGPMASVRANDAVREAYLGSRSVAERVVAGP